MRACTSDWIQSDPSRSGRTINKTTQALELLGDSVEGRGTKQEVSQNALPHVPRSPRRVSDGVCVCVCVHSSERCMRQAEFGSYFF